VNNINAIIVDDEPKACKLLQLLIEEVDISVKVVKSYTNPTLALSEITEQNIDVIFLDIEMPQMNGFDFIKHLGNNDYLVVFVTGYDQYAIQAMKLAAVGYILKPVSTEELSLTLEEVRRRLQLKYRDQQHQILLENISVQNALQRKIGIPSMKGIDFVKIESIICCKGTEKYTKVVIDGDSDLLSSYNIGEFTKLIGDMGFFQVHRSYLINLTKIKQYQKDGTLIMEDGSIIPVARRRKEEFLRLMTTLHRSPQ